MTRYEDDNLWYNATNSWIMLTQLGNDFLQNLTSNKFPELSKEFSKFLGKDISGGDIREICKEWEANND